MELNQLSFPMIASINGIENGSALQGLNAMPGLPVQDGAFVNLLDLAGDLELANSQSVDFSGDLSKLLDSEVVDSQKNELSQQMADSQMSGLALSLSTANLFAEPNIGAVTIDKSIGQIQFVEAGNSRLQTGNGIEASNALLSNALELGVLSERGLSNLKQQNADQLKSDSLIQWSAAIASGDLKSVTLEEPLKFSSQYPAEAILSIDQAKLMSKVSEALPSGVDAASKLSSDEVSQEKLGNSSHVNVAKVQEFKTDSESNSSADAESSSFKRAFKPEKIVENEDSKKPSSIFEKPASVEAKNLLLDQGSAQSFSGAIGSSATAASQRIGSGALRQPASLGDSQDQRISPQSLEFVANKVEQLKAQGGGSIRIDLAPKELGAIEVKVGMRGGMLRVEINAESASTQRVLESSKVELQASLSKVAPAEVAVDRIKFSEIGAVKLDQVKGAMSSSEQFLSAHKASDFSVKSNLGLDQNVQATLSKGPIGSLQTGDFGNSMMSRAFSGDSLMGQSNMNSGREQGASTSSRDFLAQRESPTSRENQPGFRDERREKARDQWADSQRQSA